MPHDFEEDFRDLYENAPCGYVTLRPDGAIAAVNGTFCSLTGYSREALLGKRLTELLPISGQMFYETHFAPLLRMQGWFNEVALDLVTPSGKRLPVLANATERRADDGSLVYTRVAMFEATQRRQHERELADARAALEGMNKELTQNLGREKQTAELREQFIAVLGHDLRNPLGAISAGVHLIGKEHNDPTTNRLIRLMGESVSRMAGLIDNLMDFARGRLGGGIGIELSRNERVEPLLAQVLNEVRTSYPDRTIETRFDMPRTLDVDRARLAQMFSNLLGNAITHGAHDRPIRIEARFSDGFFELAVANGGEPIPPAAMERLFQPFYRGEVRPSMQGLGLGLYIASQIAEAHGGKLAVKSDAIETRFTFRMPL